MSVVATTLGIGASTSRPATASAASAATRATRRAVGRERSYHQKPPTSTSARPVKVDNLPAHALATPSRAPRQQDLGALLGRDRPRRAEDAGDLGGEVPAAGEDLVRRAVGDQLAVAEQHDPRGEPGGELDVVRGDERRRAALAELADPAAELELAGRVHAAGRLVETDEARQPRSVSRPPITSASARRSRSPPERSRGSLSAAHSSPTASSARRPASPGSSSATRSRISRSVGLCGSSAHPEGARIDPRPAPRAPRRRAAGCSCRLRFGP